MQIRRRSPLLRHTALFVALVATFAASASAQVALGEFQRIATFPVVNNTCNGQPEECFDEETVAEIVAAANDGELLIYTDSPNDSIGFVDITDPADPQPDGVLDMGGEPTSVAVARNYALVAVNTSESFTAPSGQLKVVDVDSRAIVRTLELAGQPDAIAVSRNNRYAAIAIENERNEDLCVGGTQNRREVDENECEDGGGRLGDLPQLPAGFLVIVDLIGQSPASWTTRQVGLAGLADKFPTDPEPEFVDINSANIAAVTLQENNHIVLVNLRDGSIAGDFSAREVDLTQVDAEEDGVINPVDDLSRVPREPDAVTWISPGQLATADEGDLDGGSRTFTIFNTNGGVRFTSGNTLEHAAIRLGHYPEERSENKGTEPEGIEYALYGNRRLLFVGTERSSFIAVYEIPALGDPELLQVLPAGVGPEGLLAIPERNLFVVASEVDDRGDTIRASLTIYQLGGRANYPTIVSDNRADRTPIPWSALSALAADPDETFTAYTVYDSFYDESRIFVMDLSESPAVITDEIVLRDSGGDTFDLDPEGLAVRPNGAGFWLASEGSGSCSEVGDCGDVGRRNLLLMVTPFGRVLQQVSLPDAVNDIQRNNGFEGVASTGTPGVDEAVYVAFQRQWPLGDPDGFCRIGRYDAGSGEWTFFYYPLDRPESPNGGWVGLSELVALNSQQFAVIERDNQAGPDARIKRIYQFSIAGVTPLAHEDLPEDPSDSAFPRVRKTLVRDILPDLEAPNGLSIEKVEGLMILRNGQTYIVTDNDGVDDSSGETQLINLGDLF